MSLLDAPPGPPVAAALENAGGQNALRGRHQVCGCVYGVICGGRTIVIGLNCGRKPHPFPAIGAAVVIFVYVCNQTTWPGLCLQDHARVFSLLADLFEGVARPTDVPSTWSDFAGDAAADVLRCPTFCSALPASVTLHEVHAVCARCCAALPWPKLPWQCC